MRPVRIAIVTEIPAPYRVPLFNALATEEGIEARIVFLRERHPARPHLPYTNEFAFPWTVLRGAELTLRGRWLLLNRRLGQALRSPRPDVVVLGGWNQLAFWQALAFARLRRVPAVAWVESTARDARSRSPLGDVARRAVVRGCSGFLVPGTASRDYVASLGVPLEQIAVAPNAVDPEIFGGAVAAARGRRDDLRRKLGLGRCTFLAVGRLGAEKGLDVLLRALDGVPADLALAGTGPEEERLRLLAPPGVRFLGWLDRDSLVPWYAAADAYVLPSLSEPWGMGLNEAAAAGLPLVASDAAGAAHDLVEDGVNGFRVPAGDVEILRAVLKRLAEDPGLRAAAGERSLAVSARFTPAIWAAAVAELARRLA